MRKPSLSAYLILLMIFVWPPRLLAQNSILTFEKVTAEQGLTSNRINGIVQDKFGFLWIATNNGLNRFDGVENKQYKTQADDSSSLSANTVLTQFCDSKGQLWFLTVNYLHRYNLKTDNFEHFLLSNKKVKCTVWKQGSYN